MFARKRLQFTTIIFRAILVVVGVHGSASFAQQGKRPSMTPDEWREYQNRDKTAQAIKVLEDPDWHEHDAWIEYYRAEGRVPQRIREAIESREQNAISIIVSSDLPRDRTREVLTKFLQHHNEGVSRACFYSLVGRAMWTPERAVEYTQQNNPTVAGWSSLLSVLPKDAPQKARTMIARRVLTLARGEESNYLPGSLLGAEIEAVRVLLQGGDEHDHASIQWAVQQHPGSHLLWAAASRLPKDEETERLARDIYDDVTMTVSVRCAAALVFAKKEPTIMREVEEHILNAVREFGSRESLLLWASWLDRQRRTHDRSSNPDDLGAKAFLKQREAEGFLPVAYEMPEEFWRKHMNEIIRYPYGILGGCMCEILARKLPDEFVETVTTLDSIPEELHGPLVSAERRHVDAEKRVKEVVPHDRYVSFSKFVDEFGTAVPAITSMTLWE